MSIPAAPTLLLAVGGIVLIMGRWVPKSRWYEAIWLISMLGATGLLMTGDEVDTSASEHDRIWIGDLYAVVGQWLALLFGVLFGVGSFGASAREDRTAERLGFLSFAIAGVMLVVLSNDLITMALAAEVVQFALWALRRTDRFEVGPTSDSQEQFSNTENGLWIGIVMSSCLWLGIALLANVTGATQFDEIRLVLVDAYTPGANRAVIGVGSKLGLLAIGLIVAGFGTRLGLVPWHLSLVEGISHVRYWTAGCVVVAGQLAGALALGRLCGMVLVGYRDEMLVLLLVLAGLTAVVSAALAALGMINAEGRLRRLACAVSMLQGAWFTLGLMACIAELAAPDHSLSVAGGQPGAVGLLLFAAAAGTLGLSGLFLLFSYLSRIDRDVEFFDELLGLGSLHPASTTALLVLLGSLVGHPPLWGFWSNWLLIAAGLNVRASGAREQMTPHLGLMLLVVVTTAATLMVAAALIQTARLLLLEQPIAKPMPQGRRSALVVSIGCAIALVVVGLFPARLLGILANVHGPEMKSIRENPAGSNRGSATASIP
ncbi:MAG TPA: proton-conducting transporter membrane subunit [Schlesneria sp.]